MNFFQETFQKLEKKRPTFFLTGLIVAMSLSMMAFEWETSFTPYDPPEPFFDLDTILPPIPPIPRKTEPKQKPKPKVSVHGPGPEEIKKSKPLPDLDPPTMDFEGLFDDETEDTIYFPDLGHPEFSPPYACECSGEKDEMARFTCTNQAIYGPLQSALNYPSRARDAGIQGTVHLSFTIGIDGNPGPIQVTRGVHPILDQEAVRAVKASFPCFKPGIQGYLRAPVRYNLPVRFTLK